MSFKNLLRILFWEYHKVFNKTLVEKSNYFWEENRNKFKGQRGFVIGNGPSLKITDLELLKDEICIASNKIYLAYEYTDWRPTFHTVGDRLLWEKIHNEIYNYSKIVIVAHDRIPLKKEKTVIFKNNGYFINDKSAGFSDNVLCGIWGGRTITYRGLQIAVHLGLDPIYLIGCDHYYSGEADAINEVTVKHSGQNNHFIEGYRSNGQKVNPAPIGKMTAAYKNARNFCDARGIKIFNATRGGYLEVFERTNFDGLFTNKSKQGSS